MFLYHVYGAPVEVDTLSFHTLVGLYSLCMEYEVEGLRTVLVARMEALVQIQTKYETVVDWLDLVTKYKVDKLQILLEEKRKNLKEKVDENNFCSLLERSNGNDEYSKVRLLGVNTRSSDTLCPVILEPAKGWGPFGPN